MSIRWRKTGELVCGAKSEPMEGDCYINDNLHYELSVIQKVLIPDKDEETNGLWYWLHGWCTTSEHPHDVRDGVYPVFPRSEYKNIHLNRKENTPL